MRRRKSAIRLLNTFDRGRLTALIVFINMKIESADLRQIFGVDLEEYMKTGQRARVPLGRWKATDEEIRELQRELREQLHQIVAEKGVGEQVCAEIDKWLQVAGKTDARATGRGRITIRLELDTPRAQCMYAMLLLRDVEGLAKQVGRCRWCGRYFFDERIRTGPPNKFCPGTQHRNSFYQYPHNNNGKYRRQPELPQPLQ